MVKKHLLVLVCLLLIVGLKAQTITLKGTIKDRLQNPLPYANVIAKPVDVSENLKFAITDDVGFYSVDLKKDKLYNITISYMGFVSDTFKILAAKSLYKDIILKESQNSLKEITIELPVSYKKDTITYNTNKFVTGDERKLKNVLSKLPGVEVNKNGDVTVQGKKITKLLVEGKTFFNGGTKLAIDNIPANAIEKVQVIDNYNEISFLKNMSNSNIRNNRINCNNTN